MTRLLEFGGAAGVPAWLFMAGAIATALLAVGALLRALWHGARHLVAMVEVVEGRTRELEHNGGSSIKDVLARIESRVDSLTRRLDDHLGGTS